MIANRLALLLSVFFVEGAIAQSKEPLQFGENLDIDIRSDQLEFPTGTLPTLPDHTGFGYAISATDEILVVGAPLCDDRGFDRGELLHSGSVYIYQRDGTDWKPFPDVTGKPFPDGRLFKLFPSFAQAGDQFGSSVSISKDDNGKHTLVVGAPGARHAITGAADTGTVHLFELEAGSFCWTEDEISPLSLRPDFGFAPGIPEEWAEEDAEAWQLAEGYRLMAAPFSIPGERYGASVSLFTGELPSVGGLNVDGVLAVGAPNRDILSYDECDINNNGQLWELFAQPDFDECEQNPCPDACELFVRGVEEAGAVFVWYRVNGEWIIPGGDPACVFGDNPPELDEDSSFTCDVRRGRFYSSDLTDFNNPSLASFGQFGHCVQVVVETEENGDDRSVLLIASALFGRGGSGSVKWINLASPDEYDPDDFPDAEPLDPLGAGTYPEFYSGAPSWANRIGFDLDGLPANVGGAPIGVNSDYQLTVVGMPGTGAFGEGEAAVIARPSNGGQFPEDGSSFKVDRLQRLWTDAGFFPALYSSGSLSSEERDEGYLAAATWGSNPAYSNYGSMLFGSSVRFGGVTDDRSEIVLIGAPGLTGVQDDVDPDDNDFDEDPDPDLDLFAMGGVHVFEYDGNNNNGFQTLYDRTGLIVVPECRENSAVYRRLGESLARVTLTYDEEDELGDDLELLLGELAIRKDTPFPAFYRPRPGAVHSLTIDIDDLDDFGDVEDLFCDELVSTFRPNDGDLADRSDFGLKTSVSADGDWLAVGSPFATMPISAEEPFVLSSNGSFFMADGGLYESGEVYIFERVFIPIPDPLGGDAPEGRKETWELRQVIRPPSASPDLSPINFNLAPNVFRERFGFSLSMSEDGQTLIVGAYGGGGRIGFEDDDESRSRGTSYIYYRSSTSSDSKFEFTQPLAGRSIPGTLQGRSVSIERGSNGRRIVSGAPYWSDFLGSTRQGRLFYGDHVDGRLGGPLGIPRTYLDPNATNESFYGYEVAASRSGADVITVGSAIGPSTFDFDEFRSGKLVLQGDAASSNQTYTGYLTALQFGRSLSFDSDFIVAGSFGITHAIQVQNGPSSPDYGYVFTPLTVLYSEPPFDYPVDFSLGRLITGSQFGVGLSNDGLSQSVAVLDAEGGVAMIGDPRARGANLTSSTTGAAFILDFNSDVELPGSWDVFDGLVLSGSPRVTTFGKGLSLGLNSRTASGQPTADYVRAYLGARISNKETADPLEPDCTDGLKSSPRAFDTRNQIFMYQSFFEDCDGNEIADSVDIASNPDRDCNLDGVLDDCQFELFDDCNDNLVPDQCELEGQDCNGNGILDFCDIEDRNVDDVNADGIPDVCQCLGDVNQDGTVDGEDFNQVFDFIQASGQSDPPCLGCPEDVNNDGLVNILDLNYITKYSGTCP